MDFSRSLQGNKRVITMRPVSVESTLLLSLLIQNFLGINYTCVKSIKYISLCKYASVKYIKQAANVKCIKYTCVKCIKYAFVKCVKYIRKIY